MKSLIWILATGLIVWFMRHLLIGLTGSLIDCTILIFCYYGKTQLNWRIAWSVLILVSLLIDSTSAAAMPWYSLTSLTTIYIFTNIIQPSLSNIRSVDRLLAISIFLSLWKIIQWLLLILLTSNELTEVKNLFYLNDWLKWLITGVLWWLILEFVYNRSRNIAFKN